MKKLAVAALLVSGMHAAYAGEFVASIRGNTEVSDFEDMITREFTTFFPHTKWEIFVFSDAFTMDSGIAICNAIVGVVPKGSYQFPLHHYDNTASMQKRSMTVGERRSFERSCVRGAIQNMLSDDLRKVHHPYPGQKIKP